MKIGITGGIGSGKSYICRMLKSVGYPVYTCDDEAKRLMIENKEIIDALSKLIGDNAYIKHQISDGHTIYSLNKPVIATYLFSNPENAQKINGIVHPVVKNDFLNWVEEQTCKDVLMESAILFESGFEDIVDKVVLIYADEDIRIKRVAKRDKASEKEIRERMNHQICGQEAYERADYIFDHNYYDTTDEEVRKLVEWLNNLNQ